MVEDKVLNVPLSEFDCGMCQEMLFDPVTTSCGHTFCRHCLDSWLRVKRVCALCREPCGLDALSHPTTALLSQMLERHATFLYRKRADAVKIEKRVRGRRYGLFVWPEIKVPGETVNLHIFEAKYRVMISRAQSTSRCFVIARESSSYGCLMRIKKWAPQPDGRSFVFAEGEQRVRVTGVRQEENAFGLLSCQITEIQDEKVPDDGDEACVTQAKYPSLSSSSSSSSSSSRSHKAPDDSDAKTEESVAAMEGVLVTTLSERLQQYCVDAGTSVTRLEAVNGEIPWSDTTTLPFWLCRSLPETRNLLAEDILLSTNVTRRLELSVNLVDECIVIAQQRHAQRKKVALLFVVIFLLYHYAYTT